MQEMKRALAVAAFTLVWLGLPAAAHATVFVSNHVPGYCLDVNMSNKQVALWNCHGGANQNFNFSGYGPMKVGNECLDTQGEGKALVLTGCRNSPGQRWGYDKATRQFKNEQGWCADIQSARRDRGTPIIAWKCSNGASNQKWTQGRVVPFTQAHTLGLNPSQLQKLQAADQQINKNGGSIVGNAGGSVIGQNGAGIVAAGGGNMVAAGGLN